MNCRSHQAVGRVSCFRTRVTRIRSQRRHSVIRLQQEQTKEQTSVASPKEVNAYRTFLSASASAEAAKAKAEAVGVITKAARYKDEKPGRVVGAMIYLETEHSQAVAGQVALDSLDGTWRLVFSNGTALPALQYIPVFEDAAIDTSSSTIDLITYLGPLTTIFKGDFTWDASRAAMYFGFSELIVKWSDLELYKGSINIPYKTYTYYFAHGDVLCARSSGTAGVILMLKVT